MSLPFHSEVLSCIKSYDVGHNLIPITAGQTPNGQMWTIQLQAAQDSIYACQKHRPSITHRDATMFCGPALWGLPSVQPTDGKLAAAL